MDLVDPKLRKSLQLVVDEDAIGPEARHDIQRIRPHSPVVVRGHLRPQKKQQNLQKSTPELGQGSVNITYHEGSPYTPPSSANNERTVFSASKINPYVGEVAARTHMEMRVETIRPLNYFPRDIVAHFDTNFPPEQRHLQIRTDSNLRQSLRLRSKVQTEFRKSLFRIGFDEIETPILFKSTPEGAREFLVPTRQRGLAYALPQSPQQFKQILMASGISRYFQFAKCFRDEDKRADRQPEFTQVGCDLDADALYERPADLRWPSSISKCPLRLLQMS